MALKLTPYDLQAGTGEKPQYATDMFQDMSVGAQGSGIWRSLGSMDQNADLKKLVSSQFYPGEPGELPTNVYDRFTGSLQFDATHGWVMPGDAHQSAQNIGFSTPSYQKTLKKGFLDNLFTMAPLIMMSAFGAGAVGGAFPSATGVAGNGLFGAGTGSIGAGPGLGAGPSPTSMLKSLFSGPPPGSTSLLTNFFGGGQEKLGKEEKLGR